MLPDNHLIDARPDLLGAGIVLVDRYLIEYILGQGGQGAVYFALDGACNDRPVAVKEMRLPMVDARIQGQVIEQFRQEAMFLHRLAHPNLPKVYDLFHIENRYYLVMDYIKGKSLGELLKSQSQPFQVTRVLEWAVQLADVLAYLHEQKPPILFRDVKPGNILLDSNGSIHLIDFGIARTLAPNSRTVTYLRGAGSADYCSLEQAAGGTDQRSDVYSLGATLFHLLTLQTPPRAAELASLNKSVPSPRNWNSAIPAPLEDLIIRMMALRPEDRYGSMAFIKGILIKCTRLLEEGTDKPDPPRKKSRAVPKTGPSRSHWVVAALTAIVAAFLVWLAFHLRSA